MSALTIDYKESHLFGIWFLDQMANGSITLFGIRILVITVAVLWTGKVGRDLQFAVALKVI